VVAKLFLHYNHNRWSVPLKIAKCELINVNLVHDSLLSLTWDKLKWRTKSNFHADFTTSLVLLEQLQTFQSEMVDIVLADRLWNLQVSLPFRQKLEQRITFTTCIVFQTLDSVIAADCLGARILNLMKIESKDRLSDYYWELGLFVFVFKRIRISVSGEIFGRY